MAYDKEVLSPNFVELGVDPKSSVADGVRAVEAKYKQIEFLFGQYNLAVRQYDQDNNLSAVGRAEKIRNALTKTSTAIGIARDEASKVVDGLIAEEEKRLQPKPTPLPPTDPVERNAHLMGQIIERQRRDDLVADIGFELGGMPDNQRSQKVTEYLQLYAKDPVALHALDLAARTHLDRGTYGLLRKAITESQITPEARNLQEQVAKKTHGLKLYLSRLDRTIPLRLQNISRGKDNPSSAINNPRNVQDVGATL